MAEKLRVYFTVDTETSIGGGRDKAGPPLPLARTVFGENGSGTYGVPLIMDILEEHVFAATCFVEIFCSYHLGLESVANAFHGIQRSGHDDQLYRHHLPRF